MGMDNELRSIVKRQKDILAELENEVKSIENSDLTKENEQLKAELEQLQAAQAKSEKRAAMLAEQNAGLKNALYEQVYNEKAQIVNSTKEKLDIFFKSTFEGELNRLAALESAIKTRINNMTAILRQNNVDIKDEIYGKLDELWLQVNFKATEAQKRFAQSHGAFSAHESAEFEELKNAQISEEQILAVTKKNNVERFVGLNLLNIIGIFLIIIGVITAARYTYVLLPDLLKGIMMFVLGAAMLIAGEVMNTKKPNIFSLGITAGGVGVLYAALATSYFGLKILDMYPALSLCVLITAVAFFLSTRYNAQVILAFALVGGYLPIFSLGTYEITVYGAMVYFVILNLLALIVSFRKKWPVSIFIGLFLNISATVYICSSFGYGSGLTDKIVTVLYALFAFLNYTLIPIVSAYLSQLPFRKRDVVLLAINTFFSSLILFVMFYAFNWEDFTGALAAVFAAVYLLLGWLIEAKFAGAKNTRALFYLTGLAFVVLIIPFQFGRAWLTLGWLAEGVALTAYGILKEEKKFKSSGFVINALCLCAFILVDCLDYGWDWSYLFAYKYLAITLGSLIILGAYMYKKTLASAFQRFYKYAVIVNLWFYALYITNKLAELLAKIKYYHNLPHLTTTIMITLTFMIAYFAPRIKLLAGFGTKLLAMILYTMGILGLFAMNSQAFVVGSVPIHITVAATAILVVVSLLSIFALRDLIKLTVMERKLGVEWYPLIVSAYFVAILTQNLITQYGLAFASAWISIIYVLTALAWIVFGFARRYPFIRKFGLALALLAVAKLFLIDLASLTQGYQIISYFTLGLTLVAISFVYQYFNKRLELKMEVTDDAAENN